MLLQGLWTLRRAAADLGPYLWRLRSLVAKFSDGWLGEGYFLKTEIGLPIDGLAFDSLDWAICGAYDSLFVCAITTLLYLEVDHSVEKQGKGGLSI